MNAPRWLHRIYAFLFGYFWAPCPVCGVRFGGHEKHGETSLIEEVKRSPSDGFVRATLGKIVCKNPDCSALAARVNKQRWGIDW